MPRLGLFGLFGSGTNTAYIGRTRGKCRVEPDIRVSGTTIPYSESTRRYSLGGVGTRRSVELGRPEDGVGMGSRPEVGTHSPDPEDRVPDEAMAAAKAAFADRVGGELAVLVFDSLIDADAPAEDQHLRFEHPRLMVEARLSTRDNTISGTVNPPSPVRAVLHLYGSELTFVSEIVDGSFEFHNVAHSLVRLSFEDPDGATVVWTDWFRF